MHIAPIRNPGKMPHHQLQVLCQIRRQCKHPDDQVLPFSIERERGIGAIRGLRDWHLCRIGRRAIKLHNISWLRARTGLNMKLYRPFVKRLLAFCHHIWIQ